MNGKVILLAAVMVMVSGEASADYTVVGKIKGHECTSYIIVEKCRQRTIDAIDGPDGRLYSVKRRYPSVSDFKNGRCWIRIKSTGAGLISRAKNAFSNVQFYEKQANGQYEKIDPEYLVFKCHRI